MPAKARGLIRFRRSAAEEQPHQRQNLPVGYSLPDQLHDLLVADGVEATFGVHVHRIRPPSTPVSIG
jgi:hypothetical protein